MYSFLFSTLKIKVNGVGITAPTRLYNKDRLQFCSNHLYVLAVPLDPRPPRAALDEKSVCDYSGVAYL